MLTNPMNVNQSLADWLRDEQRKAEILKAQQAANPLAPSLAADQQAVAQEVRSNQLRAANADIAKAQVAALEGLRGIEARQAQYPGRRPNGSGPTGLLSRDEQGWREMLGEQTEQADMEAALRGRPAPTMLAEYDRGSFYNTRQRPPLPTPEGTSILGSGDLGTDKLWELERQLQENPYDARLRAAIMGLRRVGARGSQMTPPGSAPVRGLRDSWQQPMSFPSGRTRGMMRGY